MQYIISFVFKMAITLSFLRLFVRGAKLNRLNSISKKELSKFPKRLPTISSKKSPVLIIEENERAKRFINFLDRSPEPFHVVDTIAKDLLGDGFVQLNEKEIWSENNKIKQGGKVI